MRALQTSELIKYEDLIKKSMKGTGICYVLIREYEDKLKVFSDTTKSTVYYNKSDDNIKHLIKDDKHIYYIINEIRKETGINFFKVIRNIRGDVNVNLDVHSIKVSSNLIKDINEYVLFEDEETNEEYVVLIQQGIE